MSLYNFIQELKNKIKREKTFKTEKEMEEYFNKMYGSEELERLYQIYQGECKKDGSKN